MNEEIGTTDLERIEDVIKSLSSDLEYKQLYDIYRHQLILQIFPYMREGT